MSSTMSAEKEQRNTYTSLNVLERDNCSNVKVKRTNIQLKHSSQTETSHIIYIEIVSFNSNFDTDSNTFSNALEYFMN